MIGLRKRLLALLMVLLVPLLFVGCGVKVKPADEKGEEQAEEAIGAKGSVGPKGHKRGGLSKHNNQNG